MVRMLVGSRVVCLANIGGKLVAFDNACPHRGGSLAHGRLDGVVVTCPRHGWRFDVTTGRCVSGGRGGLLHHEVRTTADGVLVIVRLPGWTARIRAAGRRLGLRTAGRGARRGDRYGRR